VELLDAHLAHDPEAARQAAGLAATAKLARQAAALTPETPQRPLAVARIQKTQTAMRWRAAAWELTRLAACGALGMILGWQVSLEHSRPANAIARPAGNPAVPALILESKQAPEAKKDFWSLANLETGQRERQFASSRPASRYRLRWDSPMKMPQMEENL
jgi:hypothetical protein